MKENLTHHELKAEWVVDNQGTAVMLTQRCQDGYDEPDSVILHPWQLRSVCEHFGIVACDPQAQRTITTLKRRMQAIRDRVEFLHNYLCNHSDHKHADLSYEVTYATATLDLADEYCADFDDTERADAKLPQKQVSPKPGSSGLPAEAQGHTQTSLI